MNRSIGRETKPARVVLRVMAGMLVGAAAACTGVESSSPPQTSVGGQSFVPGSPRLRDSDDRLFMERTLQNALEFNRTLQAAVWRNAATGASGTVTPTRTFRPAPAVWCREFESSVTVSDRRQTSTGTACREWDGTWHVVDETPVPAADAALHSLP